MPNTLVQYTPNALTGDVSSLPRIPRTLSVAGAARRFSAFGLTDPVGSQVTAWPDLLGGGTSLVPLTSAPVIGQDAGGLRYVRFNGTSDALSQALARNQPHSVAILGRFRSLTLPGSGISTLVGGSNSTGAKRGNIYLDNTGWRLNGGSAPAASAVAPDTAWHAFIAVFNGASSVLRIDNTEAAGNGGTENADVFALGGVVGSTWFGPIDIVEAIPFQRALSGSERATIASELLGVVS